MESDSYREERWKVTREREEQQSERNQVVAEKRVGGHWSEVLHSRPMSYGSKECGSFLSAKQQALQPCK